MKIINKKKQDEILKRLAANAIIAHSKINEDFEAIEKFVDNTCEIAYLIGGVDGMLKVRNTVFNYPNKAGEQE